MGFKLTTLANACVRGSWIGYIEKRGERGEVYHPVRVIALGFFPEEGDVFPRYALRFQDGTIRRVLWVDSQGIPGEVLSEEDLHREQETSCAL